MTPTHYHVIEDTTNITPDQIQQLTHKLTHMYYNWSVSSHLEFHNYNKTIITRYLYILIIFQGTVRVPAPCQLAHKLAYLAGQTLGVSPNTALDELLYYL